MSAIIVYPNESFGEYVKCRGEDYKCNEQGPVLPGGLVLRKRFLLTDSLVGDICEEFEKAKVRVAKRVEFDAIVAEVDATKAANKLVREKELERLSAINNEMREQEDWVELELNEIRVRIKNASDSDNVELILILLNDLMELEEDLKFIKEKLLETNQAFRALQE